MTEDLIVVERFKKGVLAKLEGVGRREQGGLYIKTSQTHPHPGLAASVTVQNVFRVKCEHKLVGERMKGFQGVCHGLSRWWWA